MALALATAPGPLAGQTRTRAPVEIRLASGSALERQGRTQLERVLAAHDLGRWTFTRTVEIRSHVTPHSHPVLTLNTRYVDDDTLQAATFLHEQLHWFLAGHRAATDSALADLRRLYPTVPGTPPEGALDEESTRLHLLVCLLEYDAVRDVFGVAAARRTLGGWDHYTWVYRQVLTRPAPIRRILRAHGLEVPPAGARVR